MNRWRDFLDTTAGKVTMIGLILVACAVILSDSRGFFGASDAARLSRLGVFIDASTGETFDYTLRPGDTIPVDSPSGKKTGYPAEMCYWNKDGSIRTEPVPVLLNQFAGKSGPTFCPDCGRLVLPKAMPPMPGDKPPPTEAERRQRQTGNRDMD